MSPKIGYSYYIDDNGIKYPALISYVFNEHSPNNRYWNVNVVWLSTNGNIVAGTHQFDTTTGFVYSTPPGPPWKP